MSELEKISTVKEKSQAIGEFLEWARSKGFFLASWQHLPRHMSRLMLKVTAIRAEPLRDISDEDAIREGVYKSICISKRCPFYIGECWDGNERLLAAGVPRLDFEALWRGLYPEGQKSWGANPWVWVIDFDVVKRP